VIQSLSHAVLETPAPATFKWPPLTVTLSEALATVSLQQGKHNVPIELLRRLLGKEGAIRQCARFRALSGRMENLEVANNRRAGHDTSLKADAARLATEGLGRLQGIVHGIPFDVIEPDASIAFGNAPAAKPVERFQIQGGVGYNQGKSLVSKFRLKLKFHQFDYHRSPLLSLLKCICRIE